MLESITSLLSTKTQKKTDTQDLLMSNLKFNYKTMQTRKRTPRFVCKTINKKRIWYASTKYCFVKRKSIQIWKVTLLFKLKKKLLPNKTLLCLPILKLRVSVPRNTNDSSLFCLKVRRHLGKCHCLICSLICHRFLYPRPLGRLLYHYFLHRLFRHSKKNLRNKNKNFCLYCQSLHDGDLVSDTWPAVWIIVLFCSIVIS